MDGQSSQGQSGTSQQVSVSATSVGSATGSHSQPTLSIQQPPVSTLRKTPITFKVDCDITWSLNAILNTVINIKSNMYQLPVIHGFGYVTHLPDHVVFRFRWHP